MKFLTDECCDFSIIKALRENDFDIIAIAESLKGASDREVLKVSIEEQRILITEDKDFGELVYAHQRATIGVILLRFPLSNKDIMSKTVVDFIKKQGKSIIGKFIVIQPGKIRISG